MVLTFYSILSYFGYFIYWGFFLGDLEARYELVYYHQLIDRNTHNLPTAQ